ncbi:MAG: hypothetical protein FWG25_06065 [Promicromonosporaceae bacterium]|nr:hypothetical protein [Promicromonosporaceae bacterium]
MSTNNDDASWVQRRTVAAEIQAGRLAQRQDLEHKKAEAMLAAFLPKVKAFGPPPVKLQVKGYGGQGVARTNLTGWYLRVDGTAALGTDGKFYVLIAPLSSLDRIRGVKVPPSRPPLILGEGGKDGDSVDLADALERVFPGWQHKYPPTLRN